MGTTSPDATPERPRQPAMPRAVTMALAEAEYQRFLAQLRELSGDDWTRPTDCPDWDVRAMAGHVLGMAEMAASVRAGLGQTRAVERLAATAPRAARARRRTPAIVRRCPIPLTPQHDSALVADVAAEWAGGHAQPCRLQLTGPADGTWTFGSGGPAL